MSMAVGERQLITTIATRIQDGDLKDDELAIGRSITTLATRIQGGDLKDDELRADPCFMIGVVSREGRHAMRYVAPELLGDRGFVKLAVEQAGEGVLEYASLVLKEDGPFMLEVAGVVGSLWYADASLRTSPDFMLKAAARDGALLWYASDELLSSRTFMLRAVRVTVLALKYAPDVLKGDYDFMMAAINKHSGEVVAYASRQLQASPQFMFAPIKNNGHVLCYAAPALLKDKNFMMTAVKETGECIGYVSAELKTDKIFMHRLRMLRRSGAVRRTVLLRTIAELSAFDCKVEELCSKLDSEAASKTAAEPSSRKGKTKWKRAFMKNKLEQNARKAQRDPSARAEITRLSGSVLRMQVVVADTRQLLCKSATYRSLMSTGRVTFRDDECTELLSGLPSFSASDVASVEDLVKRAVDIFENTVKNVVSSAMWDDLVAATRCVQELIRFMVEEANESAQVLKGYGHIPAGVSVTVETSASEGGAEDDKEDEQEEGEAPTVSAAEAWRARRRQRERVLMGLPPEEEVSESSSDDDDVDVMDAATPLLLACKGGHAEIAEKLLQCHQTIEIATNTCADLRKIRDPLRDTAAAARQRVAKHRSLLMASQEGLLPLVIELLDIIKRV